MSPHVDILDQPDRLGRWFVRSLGFHVLVALALLTYGMLFRRHLEQWGSPTGGAAGSVVVNPVAKIPLPARPAAPENPVANDTESEVPTPPPEPKHARERVIEEPDAIPLQGRKAHSHAETAAPNSFREQQHDQPNQVYSEAGQRMSSPMFGLQGGGGVGVGDSSPFGDRFGWYAKLIVDKAGRSWRTSDLKNVTQVAVVMFTIRRDGSVTRVHITEPSGNATLDFSAQRAIFDASPFPALPAQFPDASADVELRFSLK